MNIYFECNAIYGKDTTFGSLAFEDKAGNEIDISAEDMELGFKEGKFYGTLNNCFVLPTGLDVEPEIEDIKDMVLIGINISNKNPEEETDWNMIPVMIRYL